MIKIFTTDKVKELDQYTILNEPVSSIDLVERAATVFLHEFCRRYSKQTRIIIFAGQGNNGADALAIARLLTDESYKVETFLFNPTGVLSPDCEINRQRLRNMEHIEFTEVVADFDPPTLNERDIVIDGLFGSGLNRPLTGGFAMMVNYINQSDATVVSIDIPSGLFGEDNRKNDPDAIIKADFTFTFGFPKLAFFFPENAQYVGEWKVLDIGLHPEIIEETPAPFMQITEDDIAQVFTPRERFAHKGNYGHALLIAGSKGKMGAALLSARACLRSGAGLLTAHIPHRGENIFQTAFPEAMLSFDPNADHFSTVPETSTYSAIGIGPGLGQHMESGAALERLLQATEKPMVLDADAINLLASNNTLLERIPARSILTPHPKEFDRLAGESSCTYERLQKAKAYAAEHKLCIILKGAYTATCTPEGNIYFNNCGNPGMATAGSGDVLTGVILGLLAQGYEPETAAVAGVFLHGTAGDLAAAYRSEESMIAGDITEMLGKAFKQLK
ncbi:NAD(P)H-hydrate dehydratase [Parabacteroides bouchesdurhonensis]|uniref:NAD(P)H-hydrate dehydratase n=1 Tax=Parabacteroides bouchesdurhonensis TaxID=1936995 RepID=UPI000E4A2EC3|nr:NAD(P)H-hydrate dehydratase [Parabacteroides bouchesdurhonensis]RHJ92461.1 NAD(P)H-hydrate dehydratase [Bacteroides sp. AM07-16]